MANNNVKFTFLTYITGCLIIVFRYGGGTHVENFDQKRVAVNVSFRTCHPALTRLMNSSGSL
jgi:hypothetical protein